MAEKSFELIYSTQKTGFEPGRAYSNPRFFLGPRPNVTRAIVVGPYPKIAAAYRATKIDVVEVEDLPALRDLLEKGQAPRARTPRPPAPAGLAALTPTALEDERAKVFIPDTWRELSWTKPDETNGLTLRGLGAVFATEPVINKGIAVAAIEAELARRSAL